MADEDNDDEFDVGALAALARPSAAPAPVDEDEDEDDAKVDLRALTTSMAPPAPDDEDDEDEDDDEDEHNSDESDEDDEDDESAGVASAAAAASGAKSSAKSSAKTSGKKSSKSSGKKSSKSSGKKSSKSSGKKSSKSSGKAESKPEPVVPVATEEPGGNGKMLMGVLVIGALAAGAWVMAQDSEPEVHAANQPRVETESDPVDTVNTNTIAAPIPETETVETEVETELATETVETETTETVSNPGTRMRRTVRATMNEALVTPMEATMEATTEATMEATMEAATMEAATMTGMDSVEDLLSRALGGMEEAMEAAPVMEAVDENLPDVPSRSAVTRALGGLMPRMRQCAGEQEGLATARIRVRSDGQVASANIGGRPFGGTPQGECMERIVKTARFPRFRRTNFDVTYPFSIRHLN